VIHHPELPLPEPSYADARTNHIGPKTSVKRIAAPVHPIRRSNCAESGYCELIAALKVRTSNKKGRHLSTGEAIRLIEEFGVETPDDLIKG
jgi:hypothetical protein